jgi:hypothetical protein
MCSAFATLIIFIVLGLYAARLQHKSEGYHPASAFSRRPAAPLKPPESDSRPLLSHNRNISSDPEILVKPMNSLEIPMITITRNSVDTTRDSPQGEALLVSSSETTHSSAIQQQPQPQKPSAIEKLLGRNPTAKPTSLQETFRRIGGGIERVNIPGLFALRDTVFGDDSQLRRLVIILGILRSPLLITLGIFRALYSDFALGSISSNMVGVPSGDTSWLFWGYFAFKRLPMLSA